MISDALVNDANQVGTAGIVEFEAELALRIRLGTAAFFHALAEFEQDDVIACGGLVGGSIFYRAGEVLRRGDRTPAEEER